MDKEFFFLFRLISRPGARIKSIHFYSPNRIKNRKKTLIHLANQNLFFYFWSTLANQIFANQNESIRSEPWIKITWKKSNYFNNFHYWLYLNPDFDGDSSIMYRKNSVKETSAPVSKDSSLAYGRYFAIIFRPYLRRNSSVKGFSSLFR